MYIMNQSPCQLIHSFKQFNVGDIGIATITVSELQYGAVKSKNPRLNAQRVEEFLAPMELLPYDHNAAIFYGEIRYNLEKKGQVISPLDILIAAHALSNDIILVTNNEKDFQGVARLRIENWTRQASQKL